MNTFDISEADEIARTLYKGGWSPLRIHGLLRRRLGLNYFEATLVVSNECSLFHDELRLYIQYARFIEGLPL